MSFCVFYLVKCLSRWRRVWLMWRKQTVNLKLLDCCGAFWVTSCRADDLPPGSSSITVFFFLQHVCLTPRVAAGLMCSLGFLYLCFCIPVQWARRSHGASSGGDGEEAEGAHRPPPGRSGAEDWDTSNERPAAGDHEEQHSGRTCLLQTSRDDSNSQSLSSSEGLTQL